MAESFGTELVEQLQRNIGDAFLAVSGEDLDWGALVVQMLGQLLVSVIYLFRDLSGGDRCYPAGLGQAAGQNTSVHSGAKHSALSGRVRGAGLHSCTVRDVS